MNKRSFLKVCSSLISSHFLAPLLTWAVAEKLKNWAGNLEYSTENLYSAQTLDQVQEFLKKQRSLKVLGTRHCFNGIADTNRQFSSLKALDQVVALDTAARTVTVEGGLTYGHLSPYLDSKGCALHNLASLAPIPNAA